MAQKLRKNKIYSFIGSDAHRDEKRNTDMRVIKESIKDENILII